MRFVSVFGRAQAADGIAADMRRLRAVHAVQPDRVVVDAGATWREVTAATLPQGLVPPVLPDYLDLSVGGTLSVGGVGAITWRSGVVTGQRLLLRDQRFEGLQGAVLPSPAGGWTFRLDVVKAFSGTPPDDAALPAGLSDDRPKAEPSTLAHLDHLTRFTALEQAVCSTFNLFRFPPTDRVVDAQRLVAANRVVDDRVRAAGGALYPVSAVPMSHATGAPTSARRSPSSATPSASTTRVMC